MSHEPLSEGGSGGPGSVHGDTEQLALPGPTLPDGARGVTAFVCTASPSPSRSTLRPSGLPPAHVREGASQAASCGLTRLARSLVK